MIKNITILIILIALQSNECLTQSSKLITVNAGEPGAAIAPTMWGVFFEDINLGADGGIYAELIKNRSFEFFKPLMGWQVVQKPFREGAVMVINRGEQNSANPRFLRIRLDNTKAGALEIINEGFRGMGIKKDLKYDFSFMYKMEGGNTKISLNLLNARGEKIGGTTVDFSGNSKEWQKKQISFVATATEAKASFSMSFEGSGTLDMDMVSLFPTDTWKGRPGGMRADMVQMLADMKPGFLRFPGGCIVEGHDLDQRYQWKKTIGPIEERELLINRWNFEFGHKPTPDYFQTFGLGFFEYFQLAADMEAEPLPILNCGMACQFNTAEVVPMDQLEPYIQDALDLIEFANGGADTKWGKMRVDMGHAASFDLKYLGVGNENWGPQYLERLEVFKKAINQKYPYIKIVGSSGTDPNGERFDLLNTSLRKMGVDIIDEHFYRRPEWFLQNATRYDQYPRNGSKVFAGEYAAQSDRTASANNKNNWRTAMAEAAFLTGIERNAEVVTMASYAPLFAHIDGWQWTPDLIWVDNLRVYGTPNYYVQKLYSTNKGTHVLPIDINGDVIAGKDSLYASAVYDANTSEVIIKLVNAAPKEQTFNLDFAGVKIKAKEAKVAMIAYENDQVVNTLDDPLAVVPTEMSMPLKAKGNSYKAPAYSFNVIKIPIQK